MGAELPFAPVCAMPAPAQGAMRVAGDTETFNFGKHTGKTFLNVFESDLGYVRWALDQVSPSGGLLKFADYCQRRGASFALEEAARRPAHGGAVKRKLSAVARPVLPPEGIYDFYIFFDGSCPNNVVTSAANPAGFGVVVYENSLRLPDSPDARRQVQTETYKNVELSGPVVTESRQGMHADFFIGSETGSNNTGELSGLAEALLWLLEFGSGRSALLLYDSQYAARACLGRNQIHQNARLAEFGKFLLHKVRSLGASVHLEHVKGHSGQVGNETADRLANCGAQGSFSCTGRFVRGTSSTVREVFSDFVREGGRTQSFYCHCPTLASCTAARGPNAGKQYTKCAAQRCDFWSWA